MPIERVLVALDGSEHAAKALDLACEIASRFGAELVAMHVIGDKPLSKAERHMAEVEFHAEVAADFEPARFADARGNLGLMGRRLTEQAAETERRLRFALGERLLADARARAHEKRVTSVRTLLQEGDPATAIPSVAKEEKSDLIVLGRRGLGDLAGLLLGSVSHKVTHLAECACLTVK